MGLFFYRHNKYEQTNAMVKNKTYFYELTIVLDGEMTYYINEHKIVLEKNDAIFVPPNSIRARDAVKNANYVSFNFFSNESYNYTTLLKQFNNNIVENILKTMEDIYKDNNNMDDISFTYLFKCLLSHIDNYFKAKSNNSTVETIKKYIKDNLSKQITLKDICKTVFYSREYCSRIFKKHTGKTIIDYINKERINKAKTLIIEGTTKLADIAIITGFQDYNYFSRVFKNVVGVNPKDYISSLNNNLKNKD